MDDEDYKPRSPDLSALGSYPPVSSYNKHNAAPFQYPPPQPAAFSLSSQNAYYQPPTFHKPSAPTSSSAYNHSAYLPPTSYDNGLPHIKTDIENDPWSMAQPANGASLSSTSATPGRGRKMSTKQMQALAQSQPRPPAPGDDEQIVVKTKFPVARIKRLVQADEEVGKVAQVTPPVVSKALELFMIQMTLAAVAEAQARGSKRLTAAHIKAAIAADDKFDFLSDVASKIPDAVAGKGEARDRKVKAEKAIASSEDDADMDFEHSKFPPAKRKPGGGRKKRVADDDD